MSKKQQSVAELQKQIMQLTIERDNYKKSFEHAAEMLKKSEHELLKASPFSAFCTYTSKQDKQEYTLKVGSLIGIGKLSGKGKVEAAVLLRQANNGDAAYIDMMEQLILMKSPVLELVKK